MGRICYISRVKKKKKSGYESSLYTRMSSTDPKSASFQEKMTSFYKRNEAAVKLGLASVVTLSVCGMVYYVIRKERRKRTNSFDNSSEEEGEGEEVDFEPVSSMGGSCNNSGSSNSSAPVQKKKK